MNKKTQESRSGERAVSKVRSLDAYGPEFHSANSHNFSLQTSAYNLGVVETGTGGCLMLSDQSNLTEKVKAYEKPSKGVRQYLWG